MMTMEIFIETIDDMIKIQGSDGNWDYSPYMHGLLNGLILAKMTATEDDSIKFRSPPKQWIEELTDEHKLEEVSTEGD